MILTSSDIGRSQALGRKIVPLDNTLPRADLGEIAHICVLWNVRCHMLALLLAIHDACHLVIHAVCLLVIHDACLLVMLGLCLPIIHGACLLVIHGVCHLIIHDVFLLVIGDACTLPTDWL